MEEEWEAASPGLIFKLGVGTWYFGVWYGAGTVVRAWYGVRRGMGSGHDKYSGWYGGMVVWGRATIST